MAEVAEVSLSEQREAAELDAKLQREAARKRAAAAASVSTGKTASIFAAVLDRIQTDSAPCAPIREPVEWPVAPARPKLPEGVRNQIPGRFRGATFENFRAETDEQREGLRAVRAWVERARTTGDAMLALIGPAGRGKSHLLYAAANALIASETPFYSRPWYTLADELRYGGESSFNAGTKLEAAEVRAQLRSKGIAFIDEVRPTASTAFDDTELAKFACHAYDNKLSVLITSNVYPLDLVMGEAAASRFRKVIVNGRDARQT